MWDNMLLEGNKEKDNNKRANRTVEQHVRLTLYESGLPAVVYTQMADSLTQRFPQTATFSFLV